MTAALWLPYWFWGGLCALLSVAALASGSWAFLSLSRTSLERQNRGGTVEVL